MCDLDASSPREVAIEVKFLLELEGLVPRVRCPLTFCLTIRVYGT